MSVEIVFNELSAATPATHSSIGSRWMETLIRTVKSAVEGGCSRSIRTCIPFKEILLARDYPIVKWLNDPAIDRERSRYFLALATRHPALIDLPEKDNESLGYEFYFNGENCKGLGVAHIIDGLAVSFPSDKRWDTHQIQISKHFIENDSIEEECVSIHHASTPEHIGLLRQAISNLLLIDITNGNDLWRRRGELFPALTFCDNIAGVLQAMGLGDPHLMQIRKKLFELDRYARGWITGPYDRNQIPFKVTPEHKATKEQYAAERTFQAPGGQYHIFEEHGRITPGNWRIYFDPSVGPGRILVGYIGKKPPSAAFPS